MGKWGYSSTYLGVITALIIGGGPPCNIIRWAFRDDSQVGSRRPSTGVDPRTCGIDPLQHLEVSSWSHPHCKDSSKYVDSSTGTSLGWAPCLAFSAVSFFPRLFCVKHGCHRCRKDSAATCSYRVTYIKKPTINSKGHQVYWNCLKMIGKSCQKYSPNHYLMEFSHGRK